MNLAGWIFLALGWSLATGLSVFCFYRILGKPKLQGSEEPKNPVIPTP